MVREGIQFKDSILSNLDFMKDQLRSVQIILILRHVRSTDIEKWPFTIVHFEPMIPFDDAAEAISAS